jgi:hypothetical protein
MTLDHAKIWLSCVLAAVSLLGCGTSQQPSVTQGPTVLTTSEFEQKLPQEMTSPLRAFIATHSTPQCSPTPTQAEVNNAELNYQDYYMSASRAASIHIPIVSSSGQSDFLVIIRDYRRFKQCTATDNKTVLYYGQVIRAVIELTSYKADANLSVAMFAANATISGKQQHFYLYKNGWYNQKSDGVISTVSGKVFDVENYALYQTAMPQLIALLSESGTTLAPAIIFQVPPENDPNFAMASARAYGFTQARDGKSCQDSVKKFDSDSGRAAAVVDAYSFLGKPNCTGEKIVEPEKSKAAGFLGGLSVR